MEDSHLQGHRKQLAILLRPRLKVAAAAVGVLVAARRGLSLRKEHRGWVGASLRPRGLSSLLRVDRAKASKRPESSLAQQLTDLVVAGLPDMIAFMQRHDDLSQKATSKGLMGLPDALLRKVLGFCSRMPSMRVDDGDHHTSLPNSRMHGIMTK